MASMAHFDRRILGGLVRNILRGGEGRMEAAQAIIKDNDVDDAIRLMKPFEFPPKL